MKYVIGLVVLAAILSGCSTYSANRYSISADNVVALRNMSGKAINVGPFTSSEPGENQIMCRANGPIQAADGEPFSEYIRKALISELQMANIYSPTSKAILTGNLDAITFSSTSGNWDLKLTIKSPNGKSMAVSELYMYTTSYYVGAACQQTAQALMPAVQNLIGKIVRSPEFATLISD